jgi:hypothetical protein
MNRLTRWLVCLSVAACGGCLVASAEAAPRFLQCPRVGSDTGCQYLITVSKVGVSISNDPLQPSFANNAAGTHESGTPTDSLIGVQNDSSSPVTSLNLSGPIDFVFDGDGICDNASGPVPQGCEAPSGSTACGPVDGPCSFPPPPGEPSDYTEFGAQFGVPAWPNGDVQNGYEGPTSWFSNIGPSPYNTGTVNFWPAVPPGGSTYFSLEASPKLPVTTYLTAVQTAGGERGAVLYLPRGVRVHSTAQLTGGSGHLTGHVTFQLFHNSTCSGTSTPAGTSGVSSGSLASKAVLVSAAGTYYWQVEYNGAGTNAAAVTNCGAQAVVVPKSANVGLPSGGRCIADVTAKLRLGRQAARAAEVFVNGKLVGRFTGTISVRVRKPEQLAVIASSASRAFADRLTSPKLFRQQSRGYTPC